MKKTILFVLFLGLLAGGAVSLAEIWSDEPITVEAAENNKVNLWRACYKPPAAPDYKVEAIVRCCKDGGTESCTMLNCPEGTIASDYCTENPPALEN